MNLLIVLLTESWFQFLREFAVYILILVILAMATEYYNDSRRLRSLRADIQVAIGRLKEAQEELLDSMRAGTEDSEEITRLEDELMNAWENIDEVIATL